MVSLLKITALLSASVLTAAAPAIATASDGPLKAGQLLPNMAIRTQLGKVNLRKPGGPLVIYFYPKDDTPGCTTEAKGFRNAWKDLTDLGVRVIGVSSDSRKSHQEFQKKYQLPFDLAADGDYQVAEAFGVPTRFGFFARITFVADENGRIIKTYPDVDPDQHAKEIVELLRKRYATTPKTVINRKAAKAK